MPLHPHPAGWEADRAARLAVVHADNKAALAEIIALAAPTGDPATDFILARLADKARRWMGAIERAERTPFLSPAGEDDLGHWGENGRAPAIRQMLVSARLHAASAREVRDAA